MNLKTTLFLIGILIHYNLIAQSSSTTIVQSEGDSNFCTSEIPSEKWEETFQKLIFNHKTTDAITTAFQIPVIFHIIHGGENVGVFPNIEAQQVNSQITVLNQDFTGTGLNNANYPVNAFVNWAVNQSIPANNLDALGRIKIANSEIQFCLAQVNESGTVLAEPGIERINYIEKGWQNPNVFTTNQNLRDYIDNTVKPQSIWDATKYLNIWVTDKNSAINSRGFATPPPLSGLTGIPVNSTNSFNDGVWCYSKSVGSYLIYPLGNYVNNEVFGRLLTHEIGHWLGLRHIWGDGNCVTDYCNDTPSQANPSAGNPIYPQAVGSCSSPSNFPDGEMFMNFMDYTANASMYMFTTDQVTRMQTAMATSPQRNQLGTHGICTSLINQDQPFLTDFKLYPNPTSETLVLHSTGSAIFKEKIQIINALGLVVKEIELPENEQINVAELPTGIYFIRLTTFSNIILKFIKQ